MTQQSEQTHSFTHRGLLALYFPSVRLPCISCIRKARRSHLLLLLFLYIYNIHVGLGVMKCSNSWPWCHFPCSGVTKSLEATVDARSVFLSWCHWVWYDATPHFLHPPPLLPSPLSSFPSPLVPCCDLILSCVAFLSSFYYNILSYEVFDGC